MTSSVTFLKTGLCKRENENKNLSIPERRQILAVLSIYG